MRTVIPGRLLHLISYLSLLVGVGAATPASAQVNAQNFHPAIGPENVITVDGTRTPEALTPMANLFFEFAYRPVRVVTAAGTSLGNPVDTMTTAHAMAGLGITRWLALSFDLPIVLYQSSANLVPISPPLTTPSSFGLGDFRFVAKLRIINNEEGGFGLAFVPQFTFPTGSGGDYRGYSQPNNNVYTLEPRVVADYRFQNGIFISLNAGFQGRVCSGLSGAFAAPLSSPSHACDQTVPQATDRISDLVTYGLGAYAPIKYGFGLGAEVIGATSIARNDVGSRYSPLSGYLAGRWIHSTGITVTVGGGAPFITGAGEPSFRVFAGVGFLPFGKKAPKVVDSDGDGIADPVDACPTVPGVASADPQKNGCPSDRDGDGIIDAQDQCPDVAAGDHPDPKRPGCPLTDKDGDGVYDDDDQCPDVPAGDHPDPKRPGCPLTDKDGDGVYDDVDQCIDVPAGDHPDPKRPGCPDVDTDKDGVYDSVDQCPTEPPGLNPDPARPGCPLPDRDHDLVPDAVDACPDQPGAPDPDPKKNGCPGKVEVKDGRILIKEEIFFATNKDVIQKKSFAVVEAVANTLKAITRIKRLAIEGHTDNRGKHDHNVDLSDRRAKSVMRWLVEHGVAAERLEAKGFGPDRPIADNKTKKGQALNRRVDFFIIDPPQPAAAPKAEADKVPTAEVTKAPAAPAPAADDDKATKKGKKKGKKKKDE